MGRTRPSRAAVSGSSRGMKSPTPTSAKTRNGVSWKKRSAMVGVGVGGPALANRRFGRDDQGQGRQLDDRRRGVEQKVAGQPDLVLLSGTGVEGEPSVTALPNSISGLNSSIGRGRITVVFFSDPISTIVWRNRSWRAPCWDEITWAALASVCEAWNSPAGLMVLGRLSRPGLAFLDLPPRI